MFVVVVEGEGVASGVAGDVVEVSEEGVFGGALSAVLGLRGVGRCFVEVVEDELDLVRGDDVDGGRVSGAFDEVPVFEVAEVVVEGASSDVEEVGELAG